MQDPGTLCRKGGELALVRLVQIHMGYHDDANNASR